MKRFKVINFALGGLFSLKKVWLLGSIYCLVMLTCLLLTAKWEDRGIFDLIADSHGLIGSTNQIMFIIVGIPFIVTMMTRLIVRNERALCVTKLGSRFKLWHTHVIAAVCLSFILTCMVMIISFLIGGLLVGLENTWLSSEGTISELLKNEEKFQSIVINLATYKIIGTIFITKFLGFMVISFLTLFIWQFAKNGALIMIILIALAGFDQGNIVPVNFFTFAASLKVINWIDPMVTIYHSIYFFILLLVLYATTGWLYERKDFLS